MVNMIWSFVRMYILYVYLSYFQIMGGKHSMVFLFKKRKKERRSINLENLKQNFVYLKAKQVSDCC